MDRLDNVTVQLSHLGERLKNERLRRNESQRIFSTRIGVSIPTLRKMESGDTGIQIGYWMMALEILGRINEIEYILSPPDNLFNTSNQNTQYATVPHGGSHHNKSINNPWSSNDKTRTSLDSAKWSTNHGW